VFPEESSNTLVGMKPLSERDENLNMTMTAAMENTSVGMKPLSERDENSSYL